MGRIFPYILATLTQHNRQKVVAGVDFRWEPKLWTHNIFRVYELIFWRREGIRAGSARMLGGKTACFTLEDTLANIEGAIRAFRFPRISLVKVVMPQLAYAGVSVPSQYRFAIALDSGTGSASSSLQNSITTTLSSFTVSGSNTLLIGSYVSLITNITGMNWNAIAMTHTFGADSQTNSDTSRMAQYAYVGASGTHDVTATHTSANGIIIAAAYSGVNQSTTPDSFHVNATVTAKDVTASTTVVASNCWLMCTIYSDGAAATAGTGAFLRRQGTNITICYFDSNATVGTGSQSMVISSAGSADFAYIMSSWAPVASASTNSGFFDFF